MHRLGVLTKVLGGFSETFIEDHAKRLLPGETSLAAAVRLPPSTRAWDFDGPTIVLRPEQRWLRGLLSLASRHRGVGVTERRHWSRLERFWTGLGTTHILSEYLDVGPTYIAFAKERGLAWFSFGHGYDVSRSLRSALWRRIFLEHRHADGIFVRTSVARRRLVELGLPAERIRVTPGGVPVPDRPPSRRPEIGEPFRVLTVGRLVGKKDVCALLKAFAEAREAIDRTVELFVIGDGPDRGRAERLAEKLGVSSHVRFLARQPRDVVLRWMLEADVFALHSRSDPRTGDEEGLPTVILEAMAAGLPVVSTLHAGIPEAVLQRETGLLTAEGDVHGMAEAFVELATDDRLRNRMSANSYDRARCLFTWEAERRRILEPMGLLANSN